MLLGTAVMSIGGWEAPVVVPISKLPASQISGGWALPPSLVDSSNPISTGPTQASGEEAQQVVTGENLTAIADGFFSELNSASCEDVDSDIASMCVSTDTSDAFQTPPTSSLSCREGSSAVSPQVATSNSSLDSSDSNTLKRPHLPLPTPRRLILRPRRAQRMYPPLSPPALLAEFPWIDELLRVSEPARRESFSKGFCRKVSHASLFTGTFGEAVGSEASI